MSRRLQIQFHQRVPGFWALGNSFQCTWKKGYRGASRYYGEDCPEMLRHVKCFDVGHYEKIGHRGKGV